MKKTSALDILKLLDRSNCGLCGVPTCMAFAAQVSSGHRQLSDCPQVNPEIASRFTGPVQVDRSGEEEQRRRLRELKNKIANVDFISTAERLGGAASEEKIAFLCLGRVFELDRKGDLHSECHVNTWVHVPLLHYVTEGAGADPTGDWLHFAELDNSKDWERFFAHRCEEALKTIADDNPKLVSDILPLLGGKPPLGEMAEKAPRSDWALILYPLPKVPMLVCYWHEDGEFESQLSLLFDRSLNVNLSAQSVWAMTRGIVEMCRRFIKRHTEFDR